MTPGQAVPASLGSGKETRSCGGTQLPTVMTFSEAVQTLMGREQPSLKNAGLHNDRFLLWCSPYPLWPLCRRSRGTRSGWNLGPGVTAPTLHCGHLQTPGLSPSPGKCITVTPTSCSSCEGQACQGRAFQMSRGSHVLPWLHLCPRAPCASPAQPPAQPSPAVLR